MSAMLCVLQHAIREPETRRVRRRLRTGVGAMTRPTVLDRFSNECGGVDVRDCEIARRSSSATEGGRYARAKPALIAGTEHASHLNPKSIMARMKAAMRHAHAILANCYG